MLIKEEIAIINEVKKEALEKRIAQEISQTTQRITSKQILHYRFKNQPYGFCLSRKEWTNLWRSQWNITLKRSCDVFDKYLFDQHYDVIKHDGKLCQTRKL